MNFDFGKHWDTRIVPLLSTRQVKSCITQAINTYLKYECPWRTYDKKRAPADYVAGGAFYADPYADYEAKIIRKLVRAGQFRKRRPSETEDDYYEHYLKAAVAPFMEHFERTNIASYQCMSACFYWNTTFGLLIARLVEPREKWRVLKNAWHATVVNEDRSKVFDILYWDPADVTRGGALAISEATRTDMRPPPPLKVEAL